MYIYTYMSTYRDRSGTIYIYIYIYIYHWGHINKHMYTHLSKQRYEQNQYAYYMCVLWDKGFILCVGDRVVGCVWCDVSFSLIFVAICRQAAVAQSRTNYDIDRLFCFTHTANDRFTTYILLFLCCYVYIYIYMYMCIYRHI
jgi:hypothetical protein